MKTQNTSDEIIKLAKRAKQFQRTDFGGQNKIDNVYKFIEKEVIENGGKLGRDTKLLVARAIIKYATKQVASCRKRTKAPLDKIIEHAKELP